MAPWPSSPITSYLPSLFRTHSVKRYAKRTLTAPKRCTLADKCSILAHLTTVWSSSCKPRGYPTLRKSSPHSKCPPSRERFSARAACEKPCLRPLERRVFHIDRDCLIFSQRWKVETRNGATSYRAVD